MGTEHDRRFFSKILVLMVSVLFSAALEQLCEDVVSGVISDYNIGSAGIELTTQLLPSHLLHGNFY